MIFGGWLAAADTTRLAPTNDQRFSLNLRANRFEAGQSWEQHCASKISITIDRQIADKKEKASRTRTTEFSGTLRIVDLRSEYWLVDVTINKLVEESGSNVVVVAEPGTQFTIKNISGEKFYVGADSKLKRALQAVQVGLPYLGSNYCTDEKMLAPPGPVRMGETWETDKACGAQAARGLGGDDSCITNMVVTLAAITNLHGIDCARLEMPVKCTIHKASKAKGGQSVELTTFAEGKSVMFYPMAGELGKVRTETVSNVLNKSSPVAGLPGFAMDETIMSERTCEYRKLAALAK
jgi:hypothetical protein